MKTDNGASIYSMIKARLGGILYQESENRKAHQTIFSNSPEDLQLVYWLYQSPLCYEHAKVVRGIDFGLALLKALDTWDVRTFFYRLV